MNTPGMEERSLSTPATHETVPPGAEPPLPADIRLLRRLTIVAGSAAAVVGIEGVIGIATGQSLLSSIYPGLQPIAFSAALFLVFFGFVLALNTIHPFGRIARTSVGLILAGIVLEQSLELPLGLLGGHFIAETLLVSAGQALFSHLVSPISPGTSVMVILVSVAFIIVLTEDRQPAGYPREKITGIAGLVTAIVSATLFMSYVYGSPLLYGTSFTPVSAPTALAFFFAGIALIFTGGPTAFPVLFFLGNSTRARLLRTFVPLTLVVVIAESILDSQLSALNLSGNGLQVSVSTLFFTLVTIVIVFRASHGLGKSLDASERRRREAEEELLSERKRSEEFLRSINQKLNILSSITRHDIRNKLVALRSYIELIRDEPAAEDAGLFISKADETAIAIGDQLEFTEHYQNIGVEAPRWNNLADSIRNAAANLNLPGIALDVSLTGISVWSDPLIEKVFYNLMENSLRHGEHVTEMRFSWNEDDAGLAISYTDNGVGIPDKEKGRIFDKGVGKHTGLGMFLTQEILAITGIDITETGVFGVGAHFVIRVKKGSYRFAGDQSR